MPRTGTRSDRSLAAWFTPRRVVALALTVLAVVFVLQNRQDTTMNLLGIRVTGPLWLASVLLVAVGVAIGVLVSTRGARDR